MGSFCICIITYYPTEAVIDRIKNVWASWPLLIYDNTPNGSEELLKIQGLQDCNLGDGLNHGVGVALQRLMRQAETNGIKRVLYLDQDTFFSNDSLLWIEDWMQIHATDLQKYTILNFGDYEIEFESNFNILLSNGDWKPSKDITPEDDIDDKFIEKFKKK